MIMSYTCLLLFGLVLCTILIAMLAHNYNNTICARLTDIAKIKKKYVKKTNYKTGGYMGENHIRNIRPISEHTNPIISTREDTCSKRNVYLTEKVFPLDRIF